MPSDGPPGTHNYGPTIYEFLNNNPEPGNSTASYGPSMYAFLHGAYTTQPFPTGADWGPTMYSFYGGNIPSP